MAKAKPDGAANKVLEFTVPKARPGEAPRWVESGSATPLKPKQPTITQVDLVEELLLQIAAKRATEELAAKREYILQALLAGATVENDGAHRAYLIRKVRSCAGFPDQVSYRLEVE